MSKTTPLAQRLNEQMQQDSEIIQEETRKQLASMRKELNAILQNELNTIKNDMEAVNKSTTWQLFKSRIMWPSIIGLCLGIGLLVGLTFGIKGRADKIQQYEATIQTLESQAGKAQITACGQRRRMCIAVERNAGTFGQDGTTYMVIKGY